MKQTDAIIMAVATDVNSDLACAAPNGRKCLIPLNGAPAVSYLIRNLKSCEMVSRVVLVTDHPDIDAASEADTLIHAKGDLTDCVLAGVRAMADSPRCLIMNGDMPLATTEALCDLLTCAPECDITYPIVEKTDVKEFFPGRTAYYVDTKEGKFTGSSCLLFNPNVVLSKERLLIKLLNARSNPKELLSLVGPWMAMKFMMSTLALKEFEEHLSRALGLNCRVFVSHFPELIMSIDCAADIPMMERELSTCV